MANNTNTTALSKTTTTLQSSSSTLPVVVESLNNPEGIRHFLATVPASIDQALDRPPISELIRSGARKESLEACLALEITRVSNMLTVGGNLREGQSLEIAIQLIADYPNESLEDFCLCLRRGIKGAYKIDGKSDIFRFDILVINNWMKAYLEDKYKAMEDRLMKEKEVYKDQYNWQPQTLTDEAKEQQVRDRLKAWKAAIEAVQVHPIIQVDEKKTAAAYVAPFSPEYYEMKDKIRRAASEFYKDRHSFSRMQVWTVGQHEVFAESQEDAESIYNQVTK